MTSAETLLKNVFTVIDQKDAKGFGDFLSEDAHFVFGNNPVVCTRENIVEYVEGFFVSVVELSHTLESIVSDEQFIVCRGTVTYLRHDGLSLSYPFTNWFDMRDGLITDYRIYIDASQLYAENPSQT